MLPTIPMPRSSGSRTALPLNGLNIEAATIDELRDKLPAAVIDLLETKTPGADIAIEVIGHMHTRVKIPVEPALAGLKY